MHKVKPKFLDVMHIFSEETDQSCKLFHSCEKTNMQNMIRTISSLKSLWKSNRYPQKYCLWYIRTPGRIFICTKNNAFSWVFKSNYYYSLQTNLELRVQHFPCQTWPLFLHELFFGKREPCVIYIWESISVAFPWFP